MCIRDSNWIDFKNKVIAEKLDTLKEFFGFKVEKDDSDNDYGASFLYKDVYKRQAFISTKFCAFDIVACDYARNYCNDKN